MAWPVKSARKSIRDEPRSERFAFGHLFADLLKAPGAPLIEASQRMIMMNLFLSLWR